MSVAVEAEGIAFRYPGASSQAPPAHPALAPQDARCEEGEILGILGPNGAGKSTLLRVLATALVPQRGFLRLLGETAIPPSRALRRLLGCAWDAEAHLEALSGMGNAVFFGRLHGLTAGEAGHRAGPLFEQLGMARYMDQPVATYSAGTRRKLGLVEALLHRPRVCFLDEPTTGLDAASVASLGHILQGYAAGGGVVILATHDTVQARRLCSRVAFLRDGQKVLEGRPEDLLRDWAGLSWIEMQVVDPRHGQIDLPDHAQVIERSSARLRLSSTAGSRALPAVCAAVLDAGIEIEAVRMREPDLSDIFRATTGVDLNEPS